MALIVNVGNFTAPNTNTSQLPDDFPSCDHPFIKSLKDEVACTCYQNQDAILNQELTPEHKCRLVRIIFPSSLSKSTNVNPNYMQCSRDHLCLHSLSEVANLKSYKSSGM